MALTDNSNGLSAADVAAVVGNSNGYNSGFGWGDGSFWIIILFLFAFMGNGWGGFGNNAGGAMPWMNNDIQRGFDQQSIMGGINGLTTAISNGFANAEISRCNSQANILQTLNANQMAANQNANTLAMSLQNCCCENRAGLADLKYTVATENCADRTALQDALRNVIESNTANTQRILDTMCQDKIDAKNERIADLERQLTMANLAASQGAQTSAILAGQAAQTNALEQYLAPVPRPAYIVQNPNCCAQNFNCGCAG